MEYLLCVLHNYPVRGKQSGVNDEDKDIELDRKTTNTYIRFPMLSTPHRAFEGYHI